MLKVEAGEHYLAFVLDEKSREQLLAIQPPQFEVVLCHHMTIAYEFGPEHVRYLQDFVDYRPKIFVKGFVSSNEGIEFFMAELNRSTQRPLGGVYHVTHSRTAERSSSDSNLILEGKMQAQQRSLDTPIQITGEFKLVPYSKKET